MMRRHGLVRGSSVLRSSFVWLRLCFVQPACLSYALWVFDEKTLARRRFIDFSFFVWTAFTVFLGVSPMLFYALFERTGWLSPRPI